MKFKLDIKKFEEKGDNFLFAKDKYALTKANKSLDTIIESISDVSQLEEFDLEQILEAYWSKINLPTDFYAIYKKYIKRKRLLSAFYFEFEEKRICTDSSLKRFLSLYKNDESDLITIQLINILELSWYYIIQHKENYKLVCDFIKYRLNNKDYRLKKIELFKNHSESLIYKKWP